MSKIKDGKISIELDKTRNLLFSLNALDEIQEHFGSIERLPEVMQGREQFKNIRTLLTILLNEGDDEQLTEKQVGRLIHAGNLKQVQERILDAFSVGIESAEEAPQGDEKNG